MAKDGALVVWECSMSLQEMQDYITENSKSQKPCPQGTSRGTPRERSSGRGKKGGGTEEEMVETKEGAESEEDEDKESEDLSSSESDVEGEEPVAMGTDSEGEEQEESDSIEGECVCDEC